MREAERRRLAQQHAGEVVEGSGHAITPRRPGQIISIRLEPTLAEALRQIASRRGISLSELLRQAAEGLLGQSDVHPEDRCQRCGRPDLPSWSVDSDRWNLAMGSPTGIVCPQCFVAAWERATGLRAHWRLAPENIHWPATEQPAEDDGR